VEKIDFDFSIFNPKTNNVNSITLRAKYFDKKISSFITNNKNPIVVNFGCGLDTRKYRINNSEKAIFYEIDFNDVIFLRTTLIPPQVNDFYIGQSILDLDFAALFKRHINAQFVFVFEGVLMYLEENDVISTIQKIAEFFPNSEIHFDASNNFLKSHFSIYENISRTHIKFKWSFDDDKLIEKWSNNISHVGTELLINQEKIRWGFKGLIVRCIPVLKTTYRMLHYKVT
jgi:O-methyltransferase involved in polyketide biosynthesis